jgi:hypothetical protein
MCVVRGCKDLSRSSPIAAYIMSGEVDELS